MNIEYAKSKLKKKNKKQIHSIISSYVISMLFLWDYNTFRVLSSSLFWNFAVFDDY